MIQLLMAILWISSVPVFFLGVLVLMLTRWYAGPAPGDRKPIWLTIVRVGGWLLVGEGLAAGNFLAPQGFLSTPGLWTIWLVSLTAVIAMAYGKQASTQQYALLALVGAAAERSMPLEDALAAFGHERGGWMRRRARQVAHLLLQGIPLSAAIERVPGVLPADAAPLLRVGHDTGSLPAAIRRTIATRNSFEPLWQTIVPKILYVCVFPAVAASILAFLVLKIMPQIQKILYDFGRPMPGITRWLFQCAGGGPLMWLLVVAWLLTTALAAYMVLRYAGSIRWDLPGTAWLTRRRHTATLLDALSLAAQRQKPLANTVAQLALRYPQRSFAKRLWAAYDDMQAGGDDLKSLHRRGLLSQSDLALLQSAVRNNNLAWAAEELADSNRRRMIYRAYALVQVVYPPVIFSYAAVVVVIAAALLYPLIDIIRSLVPA